MLVPTTGLLIGTFKNVEYVMDLLTIANNIKGKILKILGGPLHHPPHNLNPTARDPELFISRMCQ